MITNLRSRLRVFIAGVTEFFSSLGLPAPHFTAIAISNLELFGGALLVLGLGSRIIGLALSVNMANALRGGDVCVLRPTNDCTGCEVRFVRRHGSDR